MLENGPILSLEFRLPFCYRYARTGLVRPTPADQSGRRNLEERRACSASPLPPLNFSLRSWGTVQVRPQWDMRLWSFVKPIKRAVPRHRTFVLFLSCAVFPPHTGMRITTAQDGPSLVVKPKIVSQCPSSLFTQKADDKSLSASFALTGTDPFGHKGTGTFFWPLQDRKNEPVPGPRAWNAHPKERQAGERRSNPSDNLASESEVGCMIVSGTRRVPDGLDRVNTSS
jgi:hypothetical protein